MPPTLPCRVLWVRHGEVDSSWSARVYGDLDVPLSEGGRRQAERAAAWLAGVRLDAVVATDLSRSRFGAEEIAKPHGLPVTVERDLRELDRGQWRGLSWEEVEARFPGGRRRFLEEENYREHGGEGLADLGARVGRAVARLRARHGTGRIAVVSHLWPIRRALADALGLPRNFLPRLHVEPGAISVVDYHPTGPVLVALNLLGAPSEGLSEAPP